MHREQNEACQQWQDQDESECEGHEEVRGASEQIMHCDARSTEASILGMAVREADTGSP
jgi:hypothetical protein